MLICDLCKKQFSREQFLETVVEFADVDACPDCRDKVKDEFAKMSYKHLAEQQAEKKAIIERFMKKENIV